MGESPRTEQPEAAPELAARSGAVGNRYCPAERRPTDAIRVVPRKRWLSSLFRGDGGFFFLPEPEIEETQR